MTSCFIHSGSRCAMIQAIMWVEAKPTVRILWLWLNWNQDKLWLQVRGMGYEWEVWGNNIMRQSGGRPQV